MRFFIRPRCVHACVRRRYAVNLNKVFGPNCMHSGDSKLESGCCFVPLGYGGGPKYGTKCSEACTGRDANDDAYCAASNGAKCARPWLRDQSRMQPCRRERPMQSLWLLCAHFRARCSCAWLARWELLLRVQEVMSASRKHRA